MSGELEKLGSSLVVGQIPAMWKKKSYPSLKNCASYISDLLMRLDFFGKWLNEKLPVAYWISSLFFPHAFFTASKQNLARKETIPIDAIGFKYEMVPPEAGQSAHPIGTYGVFSAECTISHSMAILTGYGLFLEASRWDCELCLLKESQPKVLFTQAPLILFLPMVSDKITHPPSYCCPVRPTAL